MPTTTEGRRLSMAAEQVTRHVSEPPPAAVMGLLNYITATSLDEDYAQASQRRASGSSPGSPSSRGGSGGFALVVLLLFGTLVATAAVQTSRNAGESASSRQSLVQRVNAGKAELAAQRATIQSLRRSVEALQASGLDATIQGRSLSSRMTELGVTTGTLATEGPGIRVLVDDAPDASQDKQQVLDKDLQRLVNALWLVGAEAISINGQRLTAVSPIRDAGSAVTVNFRSLRRPYTVSAIGNPRTMGARLLDTTGGQAWVTLQSIGLQFEIETEDTMVLPAAKPVILRSARERESRR